MPVTNRGVETGLSMSTISASIAHAQNTGATSPRALRWRRSRMSAANAMTGANAVKALTIAPTVELLKTIASMSPRAARLRNSEAGPMRAR